MSVAGMTLERLVPGHLETDLWHTGVSGQAAAINDLHVTLVQNSTSSLTQRERNLGQNWLLEDQFSVAVPLTVLVYRPTAGSQNFVVASLALAPQPRRRHAPTLAWKDFSGGLSIEITPKPALKTAEITVKWHAPAGASPTALLAPLRLLTQLKPPNSVELLAEGRYASLISPFPSTDEEQNLESYLSVVEMLDRTQRLANVSFPVPEELSQDDINGLTRADRLLRGDTVTGTWKEATFTVTPTKDGREIVEGQRQEAAFISAAEETLPLGNNMLPLGPIGNHFLSTRIKDWIDYGDGRGRLTIIPGSVDEFESWRISGEDTAINRVIPGVSWRFRQQADTLMNQNDQLLRRLAQ